MEGGATVSWLAKGATQKDTACAGKPAFCRAWASSRGKVGVAAVVETGVWAQASRGATQASTQAKPKAIEKRVIKPS